MSIEDISNIIEVIKDKNLVGNLPKELHKYNSYYSLVKDLFFTKENICIIREIKNNMTQGPREIILHLIKEDTSIRNQMSAIIESKELKETFYRWSARIKDEEFAKNYIIAVLDDSKLLDKLNGEPSDLVELKDFNLHSKYIPAAWCIKHESTFYDYLRTQRIFIMRHNGKVYGVNVYKMTNTITIMDSKNTPSLDTTIFEKAKSEILKHDMFGSTKSTDENIDQEIVPVKRKRADNQRIARLHGI